MAEGIYPSESRCPEHHSGFDSKTPSGTAERIAHPKFPIPQMQRVPPPILTLIMSRFNPRNPLQRLARTVFSGGRPRVGRSAVIHQTTDLLAEVDGMLPTTGTLGFPLLGRWALRHIEGRVRMPPPLVKEGPGFPGERASTSPMAKESKFCYNYEIWNTHTFSTFVRLWEHLQSP